MRSINKQQLIGWLLCLPLIGKSQEIVTLSVQANEPSVVFSPLHNHQIVAASNINSIYFLDTATQQYQSIQAQSKYGVYGDPVLHNTSDKLYYAHLSKTPKKGYGDWFDRIVIQEIHALNPWLETSYGVGYNPPKMQDKPWLSSDNHSKNFHGNLYVTWTEFDHYESSNKDDFSRIRFSKLTPQSDTFSEAITISDTVGDCLDGDHTLEGVTTAVGPQGEIYAAWAGHEKIWFDKSMDGGKTWGKDQAIARQSEGWDMEMPNIMRANGMPFLVCDTARNTLYITWADEENNNANIWLMHSKDGGNSWSSKIKVSAETGHQYFPNIAIDQKYGDVYIAYYDQQFSSKSFFYDIGLNRINIENPKRNFYHRITPQSIPLPGHQIFYGDYLDLDVTPDSIAIVFTSYDLHQTSVKLYSTSLNQIKTALSNTPFNCTVIPINKALLLAVNIQKSCTLSYEYTYRKWLLYRKFRGQRIFTEKDVNKDFIIDKIPFRSYKHLKYTFQEVN